MSTKTSPTGHLCIASLLGLCCALALPGCDAPETSEVANLRDGLLDEVETCCWEWQDLPALSTRDDQYVSFASGDAFDARNFAEGASTVFVRFADSGTGGEVSLGAYPGSFEEQVDPDLIWAAADFSCADGSRELVLAYMREGGSVGPLFDVRDRDHFDGRFGEVGNCIVEQIVGEKSVGGSFRTTVIEPFGIRWLRQSRKTRRRSGQQGFNPRFIKAAFDTTPWTVFVEPNVDAGATFESWGVGRWGDYDLGIGSDKPLRPGHYQIQADCGEGFETVREVDTTGQFTFDGTFNEEHELYLEDFSYLLEDCDVRVGVYVGPEHFPDYDVGPL